MVLEDRLEDQELRASFCESDIAGPRRRALAESGTSSTVSPKSRSSESMSLPVSLDLAKPVAFRVSFPGRAVRAGSPAAGGGAIGTLGWRAACCGGSGACFLLGAQPISAGRREPSSVVDHGINKFIDRNEKFFFHQREHLPARRKLISGHSCRRKERWHSCRTLAL